MLYIIILCISPDLFSLYQHVMRTPLTLQVLKTKLQIHTLAALGGQKTLFLSSRETNGWRVPRFGWGDFLHFLTLKMQHLSSRETFVSRVPSLVWAHFLQFGGLKKLFLPTR